MQTFYRRVVPYAVFAFVAWMGFGAADRIRRQFSAFCDDGIRDRCPYLGDEFMMIGFTIVVTAGVAAWASVRFNTSIERD